MQVGPIAVVGEAVLRGQQPDEPIAKASARAEGAMLEAIADLGNQRSVGTCASNGAAGTTERRAAPPSSATPASRTGSTGSGVGSRRASVSAVSRIPG